MSASHDPETSKTLESGGSAPMPVPPTSAEHEGHAKGEHPGEHDPDYKPKAGASQGKTETAK